MARLALPVLALIALSLGGGAALAHFHGGGDTGSAEAAVPTADPVTVAPAPSPSATTPRPKPTPKPPRPTSKPTPKKTTVPASGAGTFTTAQSSGDAVGTGGSLRRYRVQVEDGIDLSARQAAAEIQQILAHPRGWAAHGRGRFQLVSENADFVIRIATPTTADRLCLANGLNTHGELNCETTSGVVVNLKRWMVGSPTFAGTPAEYRHLIINHEVGHEIGIRQHMGCPGPGMLAPVMMQQIKGLNGCRSNAYPYDEDGSYISGPIVS
ncbi:DUF3152 domain-containing protein [Streptomyces sp. ISL-36]|uniref:DUF3152 domain-containing protein n=1 Tax=Streptomyces sp. ISL-36 TaxID=2819182 RepID=UPI0027E49380|nr:DUF3152 domain-containing protein [Streptomyces sp. ISL-36]